MPITTTAPGTVAKGALTPPRISQSLDILITDMGQNRPVNAPSLPIRAEAKTALARLEALCQPAGEQCVIVWLLPISAGCAFPLPRETFKARAETIADAIGYLPKAVFSFDNQAEVMLELGKDPGPFKLSKGGFPGAQELHTFLTGKCGGWMRDRDALRRIVAIPEPPPAPELTQAEREAISDRLRAQMAAAATDSLPRSPRASDMPLKRNARLPDDVLLAMRGNDPLVMAALASRRAAEALAAHSLRKGSPPMPPVNRPKRAAPIVLPWNEPDQAGDVA
jgi:hypothetical protein